MKPSTTPLTFHSTYWEGALIGQLRSFILSRGMSLTQTNYYLGWTDGKTYWMCDVGPLNRVHCLREIPPATYNIVQEARNNVQ